MNAPWVIVRLIGKLPQCMRRRHRHGCRADLRFSAGGFHTAILALASVGCNAIESPNVADRALQLKEIRQATEPLRASELVPNEPSVREYLATAGDTEGRVILQSIEHTNNFDAQWAIDSSGTRVEYRKIDESGNLVLTALVNHINGVVNVFDPPLVLAFDEMSPDESREVEAEMLVIDQRDPENIIDRGSATRSIEYTHDQLIQTPAGEFHARCLAIRFRAALEQTEIERTSTLFIVPGIGVVAEKSNERIRVRDLINREGAQTIVLTQLEERRSPSPRSADE